MPFPSRGLSHHLQSELDDFMKQNDFVDLYKSYYWRNDNFINGFPNILTIENMLISSDRNEGISLSNVRAVANWGNLRNPARIEGDALVLPPRTLHSPNNAPSVSIDLNPLDPLMLLQKNIRKGIGPTYLSKVLRFGLPMEYGAIDSRCVRVFGEGDPGSQHHQWLSLRTRNDGYGWYISKTQREWPSGYNIWLNILRYFSQQLPCNCPHPVAFVRSGLRSNNEWSCADIEMAIFAYASQFTT